MNGFIRCVRLETAVPKFLLQATACIPQIASERQFSSSLCFARELCAALGMRIAQFRDGGFIEWKATRAAASKDGKPKRRSGEDCASYALALDILARVASLEG